MARSPRKISLEHIASLYNKSVKSSYFGREEIVYTQWKGQVVAERRLKVTCWGLLECLPA